MNILLQLHHSDFKALSDVARVTGLDVDEICRLAIHRYTRDISIGPYNVLEPLGLTLRRTEAVLSRCCPNLSRTKARPLN